MIYLRKVSVRTGTRLTQHASVLYAQICKAIDAPIKLKHYPEIQQFVSAVCLLNQVLNSDDPAVGLDQKKRLNALLDADKEDEWSTSPMATHSQFIHYLTIFERLGEFHIATRAAFSDPQNLDACVSLKSATAKLRDYIDAMGEDESRLLEVNRRLFQRTLPLNFESFETEYCTHEKNIRAQAIQQRFLDQIFRLIGIKDHESPASELLTLPIRLSDVGDTTRQVISGFHDVLFPTIRNAESLDAQSQRLIAHLNRIRVNARVLDCLAPTHGDGSIDQAMANLSQPVQTAMTPILEYIQAQSSGTTGDAQRRWAHARQRLVEIMEHLAQTTCDQIQESKVVAVLQRQLLDWRDTCSVGIDLQAIGLKYDIVAITANNNETGNSGVNAMRDLHLPLLLQGVLQNILKTVLPDSFANDVHHINHLIRAIYSHYRVPVPLAFNDEYIAGRADVIDNNANELVSRFADPLWMFDALDGWCQSGGQSLVAVSDVFAVMGRFLDTDADPVVVVVDFAQRIALIKLVMAACPTEFLRQIGDDVLLTVHLQVGEHGLIGIAAQSGQLDVFNELVDHFGYLSNPYLPDRQGYTMLDHALLGNNLDIVAVVFNLMGSAGQQWLTDDLNFHRMAKFLLGLTQKNPDFLISILKNMDQRIHTLLNTVTGDNDLLLIDGLSAHPLVFKRLLNELPTDVVEDILTRNIGIDRNLFSSTAFSPRIMNEILDRLPLQVSMDLVRPNDSFHYPNLFGMARYSGAILGRVMANFGQATVFDALNCIQKAPALFGISDQLLAHTLAEFNGGVLRDSVAGLSEDQQDAVMALTNHVGFTTWYVLARNNGDVFKEMIDVRPSQRMAILNAPNPWGMSNLFSVLGKNPDCFEALFNTLSPNERVGFLMQPHGDDLLKQTVGLALIASRYSGFERLFDQMDRDQTFTVLNAKVLGGKSILAELVNKGPLNVLIKILKWFPDHIPVILATPLGGMQTVGEAIIQNFGGRIQDILSMCDAKQIDDLFKISDHKNRLVDALASSCPEVLRSVLVKHNRLILPTLQLKTSGIYDSVAATLARRHPGVLADLILDCTPDDRIVILRWFGKGGMSLAHQITDGDGALALERILMTLTQAKRVEILRSESRGIYSTSVANHLTQAPTVFTRMLHELPNDQSLEILCMDSVMTSCILNDVDLSQVLINHTPNQICVALKFAFTAHRMADVVPDLLRRLLARLDQEQKNDILNLSDNTNRSVLSILNNRPF